MGILDFVFRCCYLAFPRIFCLVALFTVHPYAVEASQRLCPVVLSSPRKLATKTGDQSKHPNQTISDIQFAFRSANCLNQGFENYAFKASTSEPQLLGSSFVGEWRAEGKTGFLNEKVEAANRTITVSLSGDYDSTKGDPKDDAFSKTMLCSFINPTIYIPRLEANPEVTVTIDLDLDAQMSAAIPQYANTGPYCTANGEAKIFFLNLRMKHLSNSGSDSVLSTEDKAAFHHKITLTLCPSFARPKPRPTDAPLLNADSSPAKEGPVWSVKLYEILEYALKNDKTLQSEPPQSSYNVATNEWITIHSGYERGAAVRATLKGNIVVKVGYSKLPVNPAQSKRTL